MTTEQFSGAPFIDFATTKIMGVLNCTPDSFYAGSRVNSVAQACERAEHMLAAGVDIFDVGGESTRPGAVEVTLAEELDRVLPVITALKQYNLPISIDTSRAEVMQAAADAGATLLNDVRSFTQPEALATAANLQLPICIMHMQNQPHNMQHQPEYDDVVTEVYNYLEQRINECVAAGIAREHIIIDPGFGFGKSLAHNLSLLKNLTRFHSLNCTILVGLSRKRMFGTILDKPEAERLYGTLAATTIALQNGAKIIRTHDVAATKDIVKVVEAYEHGGMVA